MLARLSPAQIVIVSFIMTILGGAVLLYLPISQTAGTNLSFIDALFTATSATCVTGLTVVDTGTAFSHFGQCVILLLIQIGGLGLMTLSTYFLLLLGRTDTVQNRRLVMNVFTTSQADRPTKNILRNILILTFGTELLGCLILAIRFSFLPSDHPPTFFNALFHSVSAFCNAGFSLYSDSLSGFRNDPVVNLVIILLILIGGSGFYVLTDCLGKYNRRNAPFTHYTLQTKMVVSISLSLILVAMVGIFIGDYNQTMAGYTLYERLIAALFQSVSTRTAGFNTIDIGLMSPTSLLMIIMMMFVGASPGSTGGGIKTTTFGVLLASVWAMLKSEDEVNVFKREIPRGEVHKALSLITMAILVVMTFTMLLLFTQDELAHGERFFLNIAFEAVSAFGTVGLSTGITNQLDNVGRILLITLMLIGRVGPLTLVLAIGQKDQHKSFSYPKEQIMIG